MKVEKSVMSVIVSLCLSDGIVMAADSRLTRVNKYMDGSITKSYEDNIMKLFELKNKNIGILWCGDYKVGNDEIPEFIEKINNKINIEDSVEMVANIINSCCLNNYRSSITWQVAGYNEGKQFVYQIVNDSVTRKNIDPSTGSEGLGIIWDGERTISGKYINEDIPIYIDNKRKLRGSDIPNMSIDEGVFFTKALLEKSCEQLDDCEKPIDVLAITPNGLEWKIRK